MNQEIIQEIIQKIQKSKAKVVIVSGGSASGKGFLVNSLIKSTQNSSLELKILGMDDYYKSEEVLKNEMLGDINWDIPAAVKIDVFCRDIVDLKNGKEIEKPFYIHQYSGPGYEDFGRKIQLQNNQILLVEGVFSSLPEVCDLADFIIYNSSDIHSRLIRRFIRDYGFQKDKIKHKDRFFEDLLLELLEKVFPENHIYCKPKKIDFVFENKLNLSEVQSDENLLFQQISNATLDDIKKIGQFYSSLEEDEQSTNSGIILTSDKVYILKEFKNGELYALCFNSQKKPLLEKLISKFYNNIF
jgi:uridine kinase